SAFTVYAKVRSRRMRNTVHDACEYSVSNGLLKKPSLYLSNFIEKNKSAYYEALTKVRTDNDLVHLIKFFLEAVISTANSGVDTFKRILSLKNEMESIIVGFGKKAYNASKLIEYLYQKPIISINEILEPLDISSKSTASSLVKEFEKKGILVEVTGYERNKLFAFEKYLNIYSKV
ncbi:hypothetical protein QIW49_09105, partial [Francisellaceae bacterium CB300]